MTALLERERELAEFDAVLDTVGAGRGCAVSVEANAGLGKTRLLQEARNAGVSAGLNVLTARATELERHFPFSLVRQLFASPLAALPPRERDELFSGANAARGALGLDTSGERTHDSFAVLHGLYWVTAGLADRKPLLLGIDDLHWSDAASLDYFNFLLPRLEELPVLLIVTSRSGEPNPPDGLGRILDDTLVRHMTAAALSAEATTALLAQELSDPPEPKFAETCHQLTGGNPFLLCELVRALVEQGIEPTATQAESLLSLAPQRVARMVMMRLARLPPPAEAVARSLAILGDDTDLNLVAELAGIDPDATRQAADALRASAIFDPGSSLRFIHPLVRNAIYAEAPVEERAAAHARAASILRAHDAGSERVATQLLASETRGEGATVETLIDAGRRALATGAPRSAIAYLTRALYEPPPPDLRVEVLSLLIVAALRAVDHSVLASIETEVFSALDDNPSLRSRWALRLTMWMALSGRFEEAASVLSDGIEVALSEGDLERAFQLEAQLSTIARVVPSAKEVNLEHYADRIDPDSPAGRLAAAMEVRSLMANGGTARETTDAAKRALGNDGIIFAEEPELIAAPVAVMSLVTADEMDAARYAAERALAIALERNSTPELARARFLTGFVAWDAGDLATAEADFRQAVDLARLAGIVPGEVMFTPFLSRVLIERDELDAAEATLLASGSIAGSVFFGLLVRGQLRFVQGKFEQAVEDFATISTEADGMGVGPNVALPMCRMAARALMAIGEDARAREMAEGMMVHAKRWGTDFAIAHVLCAIAATREGTAGIELLETAVTMLDESPKPLPRAQAHFELGQALRREGRRMDARVPLREAFEVARRCGAVRLAKLAHGELQATGETVRRYTQIGVESLTPSQRRVAEMAASGLSNREIAQSLFVTIKTVEAHLSAAYDKLDISSRRQLAGALAEPSNPTI